MTIYKAIIYKYKSFTILFLLLLFLTRLSLAQSYIVSAFGDKDSPPNVVYSIVRDHHGYIWYASYGGGLFRIDGFDATRYRFDPFEERSLSINMVLSLFVDSQNTLWVGTDGGGIDRFNRTSNDFKRFLDNNIIVDIVEDNNSNLIIGSHDGVFRIDKSGNITQHFLPGEKVWRLHYLNNVLYISTEKYFARVVNDEIEMTTEWPFIYQLHGSKHDNKIWAATVKGLYIFSPNDFQLNIKLGGYKLNVIEAAGNNQLWLGTANNGLLLYDSDNNQIIKQFTNISSNGSLKSNDVKSLHKDLSGLLWVGTATGVSTVKQSYFTEFKFSKGNRNTTNRSNIVQIISDVNDVVWSGTVSGHIDILDLKTGKIREFAEFGDEITGMVKDKSNNIWVSTVSKLFKFDRLSNSWIEYTNSFGEKLFRKTIASLKNNRNNEILVAMPNSGYGVINAQNMHVELFGGDVIDLEDSLINDMIFSKDGAKLYFSSWDGLRVLDRNTKSVYSYKHEKNNRESLSHNRIVALFEASNGLLWVGTSGGGLSKLQPMESSERFVHYTQQANGLADNLIRGIVEDNNGFIWVSTANGLSKINPKNDDVISFNGNDGLSIVDFNHRAIEITSSGKIVVGGENGVVSFDPEEILPSGFMPPVRITKVEVDRKEVKNVQDEVLLDYTNQSISFMFASLDYRAPKKIQYAYKLEGFDPDWNYIGNRNEAVYTNLEAGHYLLRIKATNSEGIWSENQERIIISVAPPPWKTRWAYTIYVLTVLLIIGLYLLYQKRKFDAQRKIANRLKEIDDMRDQFLSFTSHELRNPLQSIMGISELLLDNHNIDEETEKQVGVIQQISWHMQHLIQDISDFVKLKRHLITIRPAKWELRYVISDVFVKCFHNAKDNEVLLVNDIACNVPHVWIDRLRIEQVLINLVNNAIKFSPKGTVYVTAVFNEKTKRVLVVVGDTGVGIPEEKLEKIFEAYYQADNEPSGVGRGSGIGLAVCKELVELHGGKIWAQSALGSGAHFCFDLPVNSGEDDGDDELLLGRQISSSQKSTSQWNNSNTPN